MLKVLSGLIAFVFCVWWIGFVASAVVVVTEPSVIRVLGFLIALPVAAMIFKGTFWLLESADKA